MARALAPVFRGQGNQLFKTDRRDKHYARGQEVPYDVNGAPTGAAVADADYGDIVVSGTGTVWSFDSSVVSAFARTILDDVNAGAVRTTLGLGYFATGTDAANLTGTISVNRFNSGAAASSSTFLRGDGTWAAAGVSDGDKGDVIVSAGGTVWTVDGYLATDWPGFAGWRIFSGGEGLGIGNTTAKGDAYLAFAGLNDAGIVGGNANYLDAVPPPYYDWEIGRKSANSRVLISGAGGGAGTAYEFTQTPYVLTDLVYHAGNYRSVVAKNATYTETTTTGEMVILASGTFTINLPTAVGNKAKFNIKLVAAGTVTIDPNGAQTIDGAATHAISVLNQSITIVSNNANWFII